MKTFPYKCAILMSTMMLVLILLMLQTPITTPERYLVMADQRTWLHIPNAWNVLSNISFLLVGAWALLDLFVLKTRQHIQFIDSKEKLFYVIFFIGVFFVGFGSGYYHTWPTNIALMWDRLPIAIAMMAFVAAIVGERINLPFARFMVWPLLVMGLFSVVYWYITIEQGAEDLRLYTFVLVFFPIIAIPLILLMFRAPYTQVKYLWFALLTFVVARICEGYDKVIYDFLNHFISGHTLKHLLLAVSCLLIYLYVRKRRQNRDYLFDSALP